METFWREVADPICAAGAAPLMLDHVVKNAAARGSYSYGSERKASGAIVHLGTQIVTPFGRGRTGASALACHRDRQGYLPRPKVGLLELAAEGPLVSYSLRAELGGDEFRPTHQMEKVSRYLESQSEPVSRNAIEHAVSGNANAKRIAVDRLIGDGYATETDGSRGAKLIASACPYREAKDELRAAAAAPSLTSSPHRDEVGTRSGGQPQSTSSLAPSLRWDEVEVEADADAAQGRGRDEVAAEQPPASVADGFARTVLIPGDDGFLDLIADAHAADHITTGEALERERLHEFVLAAGGAA